MHTHAHAYTDPYTHARTHPRTHTHTPIHTLTHQITPSSKGPSGAKYRQQSMTDYYDDSTPWVRMAPEEEEEDEVLARE